jgi:hypothetical protein
VLRRALLATLLVSAITPVLCAKERILRHRIGGSQSTLFIANADGSEERPCSQISALLTTPHSPLKGSGTAIATGAAAITDSKTYSNPVKKGDQIMATITTKDGTQIYYKDWGKGQPIVFSHGWPLNSDDWDAQMLFFLQNGYRVIALDRRGHGRSTQTWDGNDMDHCADDLAELTEKLDLLNLA